MEKLDIFLSARQAGIHSTILKKLAEVIAKPFFIVFKNSERAGEVLNGQKGVNIVPIFKKMEEEEDLGNYQEVCPQTLEDLWSRLSRSLFLKSWK